MSAPAATSSPLSPPILYAQVMSARDIGFANPPNKLGLAVVPILHEALRIRKAIEQPTPEQQREIDQLQQAHDHIQANSQLISPGWEIVQDSAFLVIGSGIPQETYDRITDEVIKKYGLIHPNQFPPSKPKMQLPHPGCQCTGGCGAGKPLPPPLHSEESINVELERLASLPQTSLMDQIARVRSLVDSVGYSRAAIALLEEAIRLREAITPQTDTLIQEIGQLKEAHQHFSKGRLAAWYCLQGDLQTSKSLLTRESHDRVLKEVIHKFRIPCNPPEESEAQVADPEHDQPDYPEEDD